MKGWLGKLLCRRCAFQEVRHPTKASPWAHRIPRSHYGMIVSVEMQNLIWMGTARAPPCDTKLSHLPVPPSRATAPRCFPLAPIKSARSISTSILLRFLLDSRVGDLALREVSTRPARGLLLPSDANACQTLSRIFLRRSQDADAVASCLGVEWRVAECASEGDCGERTRVHQGHRGVRPPPS